MKSWASQYLSNVTLTFQPEIFPGMIVEIETSDINNPSYCVYVEQVMHNFSYTDGFQTQLQVSALSFPATTTQGTDNKSPTHPGLALLKLHDISIEIPVTHSDLFSSAPTNIETVSSITLPNNAEAANNAAIAGATSSKVYGANVGTFNGQNLIAPTNPQSQKWTNNEKAAWAYKVIQEVCSLLKTGHVTIGGMAIMLSWRDMENSNLHWNPIGSTLPYNNSTGNGLQNYNSFNDGVIAVSQNIVETNFYPNIGKAIVSGNPDILTDKEFQKWGTGSKDHALTYYTHWLHQLGG
jgi:hypothetical protein